jgi:diketogulonate reductase-like aldo/keto reductase
MYESRTDFKPGGIFGHENTDEVVEVGPGSVSNFDLSDLEEVWDIAGEGHLVCNQVLYHLQERAIEHAVIPWCVCNRRHAD